MMDSVPSPRSTAQISTIMTLYFGILLCVLAVFQSSSLVTLSYDLPPTILSEHAVSAAENWHEWMAAIGAVDLSQFLTELVLEIHDETIK